MNKIIAVINDKGGVGKTTTTINVSSLIALAGFKVLVIDFSKQANATNVLSGGLEFNDHIGFVLLKDKTINEILYQTDIENLYLAPSKKGAIRNIRLILNQMKEGMGYDYVFDRLKMIKEMSDFDYILIDCDPDFNIISDIIIYNSDSFIVPIETSEFSIEGIVEVVKEIEKLKGQNGEKSFNKVNSIRFLISRYDSRNKKALTNTLEQLDPLKKSIFDSKIRNLAIINDAHIHKKPVVLHDSESNGTKDFVKLAEEIINKW